MQILLPATEGYERLRERKGDFRSGCAVRQKTFALPEMLVLFRGLFARSIYILIQLADPIL
jgi:hypothetical protein